MFKLAPTYQYFGTKICDSLHGIMIGYEPAGLTVHPTPE